MTEFNMVEPEKSQPANGAMKATLKGAFALMAILVLARMAGILPMPRNMSPAGVIAFCVAMTSAIFAVAGWYLKRTDEHDLHANVRSMAWAWFAGAVMTIDWAILHEAGVAPRPDAMLILVASAVLAAGTWLWLRFR